MRVKRMPKNQNVSYVLEQPVIHIRWLGIMPINWLKNNFKSRALLVVLLANTSKRPQE